MFIAFEGVDGSGKGLQIKQISESLARNGHDVVVEHDPQGTPLADAIRKIVLDKSIPATDDELLLLFITARASLSRRIRKNLAEGRTVLVDRWTPSTVVYQCKLGSADYTDLQYLNASMDIPKPSMTFFIDVDAEVAFTRVMARGGDLADRFESQGLDFLSGLVDAYRVVRGYVTNSFVIDGNREPRVITNEILAHIRDRLACTPA